MNVPSAWTLSSSGIVNRATRRLLFVGNGDLASLPTIAGNGDVDPAALPDGRVVVEVEYFCRLACAGPTVETSLPLDWSAAQPFAAEALPCGHHRMAIQFRWFDQPLFLVALWTDTAPAADIAAIANIAKSVRPEPPPPARGEFRGWDGLGAADQFPVGTVRLQPLPAGAVIRPQYTTVDNVPYFLVRGRQNVYAFVSRPLVDQRCEIQYDASSDHFHCTVGSRTYEWSRFGRYLGPEPASDLAQHRVIIRDGAVWVRYIEAGLSVPSVQDEAAER